MTETSSITTTSKRKTNNFLIRGKVSLIFLGDYKEAIVDTEALPALLHYQWRAVKANRCWYAKTTVGTFPNQVDLSMHRIIAKTPRGKITHHRNRNSLDNRKANLLNMLRYNHERLHRNNSLLIKFENCPDPEKLLTEL